MPWYVYSLAKGSAFYWGTGALLLAVLLRLGRPARARRMLFFLTTVVAIALVAISAAALPFLLYGVWAAAAIGWLIATGTRSRRAVIVSIVTLAIVSASAVATELAYAILPSLPTGNFPRLYVVGDSISAGMGLEHDKTWPALIASEHHVEVVDVSQAGATIAQAQKRLARVPISDGLVLLEIGGNDMLGHAPVAEFARDLDSLVKAAEGPGRRLVMLGLPLLPFDNAYGVEQRRIARKHQITLIPKRLFVDVLQVAGATSDGLHLTAAGQRQLEQAIWGFVGPSLRSR